MAIPQFIDVNTRQQITSSDIFDRPPLLTSSDCNWNHIYLEYHQQKEVDTSEIYNCNHVLFINLSRRCKQGDFWLNGKFQKVVFTQPGVIAIKPAEATHRFLTAEGGHSQAPPFQGGERMTQDHGEFITIQIKPKFVEQIGQNWVDSANIELIPRYYPQSDLLLLQLGLALKAEIQSGCLGGKIYGDSIATTVAAHLLRKYSTFNTAITKEYKGLAPNKLANVIDYIQTYLELNLGLEELAKLSDLSPYYFSRLFKQSTGFSPYQYISQQRIARARQLLQDTGMAIAQVALHCGFSSQSSFSKTFRKAVGITPRQYRQSFF